MTGRPVNVQDIIPLSAIGVKHCSFQSSREKNFSIKFFSYFFCLSKERESFYEFNESRVRPRGRKNRFLAIEWLVTIGRYARDGERRAGLLHCNLSTLQPSSRPGTSPVGRRIIHRSLSRETGEHPRIHRATQRFSAVETSHSTLGIIDQLLLTSESYHCVSGNLSPRPGFRMKRAESMNEANVHSKFTDIDKSTRIFVSFLSQCFNDDPSSPRAHHNSHGVFCPPHASSLIV